MYCKHCGNNLHSDAKFCNKCGKKVSNENEYDKVAKNDNEVKTYDIGVTNTVLTDENRTKLQKTYKDTGNTSVALSIFGFIVTIILELINPGEYTYIDILFGALIILPLFLPFIYFGKKLKDKGIDNLKYALKVSKGMIIYTILFIIIGLLGGGIGWLWLLLLYYFFRSYKETKKFI